MDVTFKIYHESKQEKIATERQKYAFRVGNRVGKSKIAKKERVRDNSLTL